jgi:hypothetical protein
MSPIDAAESMPSSIGPYSILETLSRGGMGVDHERKAMFPGADTGPHFDRPKP